MSIDVRTEYLKGDGLLPQVSDLHLRLQRKVLQSQASSLDLSNLGEVDISFVQLLVSTAVTARRQGRALALVNLSPMLRSTFERTGIGFDPVHGHIQID